MTPGPLLATIVDTVTGQDGTGLAGCSDDQLMGIISAARRIESRTAWTLMAAIAEFAARHDGSKLADEFAPVELADELHLTPLSAADQMHYASTVARRLPRTFAALAAGRIHPVHVRIIEDETSVLSDQDAAKADAILADAAPGKTFGELRSAAHKLILKLDPEAAKKRKESAKQEAHVRPFRENSGNAGMVARELPSDEVLASWQHVEQRALDLRAAGMPGTLRELRVRAYLDLLQEPDSRDIPVDGEPARQAQSDATTDLTYLMGLTGKATPAGTASAVTVLLPSQARLPGRASRRWSPSRFPGPPCRAGPRGQGRPTDSARWTGTTPATWPPPRPATPALVGASPRCTPTAPPPPTAASQVGISRPAPGPPVP
jgi:hypothetical protein